MLFKKKKTFELWFENKSNFSLINKVNTYCFFLLLLIYDMKMVEHLKWLYWFQLSHFFSLT